METGISDHVWSIDEIVGLLEEHMAISQILRIGVDSKNGGFKAVTLQYDYTLNGEAEVGENWFPIIGTPTRQQYAIRTFMLGATVGLASTLGVNSN